jgi:type III restriction enzyme
LETTPERSFEITEQDDGPFRQYIKGPYGYQKHALDLIGDHPNVNRWTCNLVYENAGGFSLPVSPGRLFLGFLVELDDG